MKGALLFGVLCMVLGATTPQPFSGPDAQRWQQYKVIADILSQGMWRGDFFEMSIERQKLALY